MDLTKKQDKNNESVPWYFGRKFWGVLVGFFSLPPILFIYTFEGSFFKKIITFLKYFAEGFYIFLGVLLNFNINVKWTLVTLLIYYILLGLLFYFGFKKTRVKIIFPILIIVITVISTLGFGFMMAF